MISSSLIVASLIMLQRFQLMKFASVGFQNQHIKSICLISKKRCNFKKLARIREEDIMLLSNRLHSSWLATRSHEAESVAPSVEDCYSIAQLVKNKGMLPFPESTKVKNRDHFCKSITLSSPMWPSKMDCSSSHGAVVQKLATSVTN